MQIELNIRSIPIIPVKVMDSWKTIIPTIVATIGSTKAMTEALPGSVFFNPKVYKRKGNSVEIMPMDSEFIMDDDDWSLTKKSALTQNGIKKSEATKKVYEVTVIESYFFKATLPKIVYKAYPIPEPIPVSIPRVDILLNPSGLKMLPRIPVVNKHPINESTRAVIFCFVICSPKNIDDIIITKQGAVYRSIAAMDRVVSFMVMKYITLKNTMLKIPVPIKSHRSFNLILSFDISKIIT